MKLNIIFLVLCCIFGFMGAYNVWINAPSGGQNCLTVCSNKENCQVNCDAMQAVQSSVYQDGRTFYVCAARDGRPGWNLHGWNVCGVTSDMKEHHETKYACLCSTDGGNIPNL